MFHGHRFFVLENAVKAVATFFIDKLYVFERDVEKRTLDPCQSGLRQKEKCESSWKMHLQSIFKTSCKSCSIYEWRVAAIAHNAPKKADL